MISEISFKFCPKCKGKFKKIESDLLVCSKCDLHFYINPRPCNAVIILNEKNEILLIKRKLPPKKGSWDLAGGFTGLNESMEESVIREVKEELNITLNKIKYFISLSDRYGYKGLKYHTLGFAYIAYINKSQIKKIKPLDDAADFKFFSLKDIPFEKIGFKIIKKTLRLFLSSLNKPK